MVSDFNAKRDALISTGTLLYQWGMVPATSGNFSARLSDNSIAITRSGAHKGHLCHEDIMQVDSHGKSLDERKPSAETLLHTTLYQRCPEIQVILHPHSLNATLISRVTPTHQLTLTQYELLKAFPNVETHDTQVNIPIFDNDQDIDRLSKIISAQLDPMQSPGYLIRGHGFYTWGADMHETLKHIEALEFLFKCEYQLRKMKQ